MEITGTKKVVYGPFIVVPIILSAFLSGIVYFTENLAIPLTLFQVTLIGSFLYFFIKSIGVKNGEIYTYGLEKEYVLFLILIFISLIYSPEREQGLLYSIRFIVLLGLTYLIYNSINTLKELRVICYSLILIGVLVAAQNLFQIYTNPEVALFNYVNEGKKLIRSQGAETDPNIFASNFIMPIMFLVAYIGEVEKGKVKMILVVFFGIVMGSVLMTYSRSAWVSIFFGALFILIYQKNYKFIGYCLIMLLIVVIGSETIRGLVISVGERVIDIFSGTEDDSSRFRIILLETSIIMWLDSYTFGYGYQSFSTIFSRYHPPQEVGGVFEPHNEFYAILVELGLIGLLVYIIILFKIAKAGWLNIKRLEEEGKSTVISLSLLASFISYLIFFQFLGGMHLHGIFMINVGLLFSVSKLIENQKTHLAAKAVS